MGRRLVRARLQTRAFYSDRRGWVMLAATSLVVGYGGGAVMFWFHAVYLEEGGPAISPWVHWLVDSSAGFLTLTPLLAVVLPFVVTSARPSASQVSLRVGGLIAVATAPAPILHDELIGRGTWLADQVTHWLGNGHEPTGTPQDLPYTLESLQQVAVGIPTYVALVWLTFVALAPVLRVMAPKPSAGTA